MRFRLVVLLAVALGVGGGVLAAVLVPRTRAEGAQSVAPVSGSVLRTASARPQPTSQVALRVAGSGTQLVARQRDPRGGPDWALRVATAVRVVPKKIRRPGVDPVLNQVRCVQVVRLVDNRPGWLDQLGTWRPVRFQLSGAPMHCLPRTQQTPKFSLTALTAMRFPDGDATRAQRLTGFAYGLTPRGSTAQVQVPGRTIAVTAEAAYLVLYDPAVAADRVTLRATTEDGKAVQRDNADTFAARQAELIARAPDPAGGLPYAATTSLSRLPFPAGRGRKLLRCTNAGARILDDRVGQADLTLGTFTETLTGGGGCGIPKLTRDHPFTTGISGGNGRNDGGTTAGQAARRLQPGHTLLYGTTLPDVESITIATPRDVRTVIPYGARHGFLAVYDGDFPTGTIQLTAHFADGTTARQDVPAGLV